MTQNPTGTLDTRTTRNRPLVRALLTLSLASVGQVGAATTPNGATIYQANCAGCHGPQANGNIGPKLAGEVAHWSYADFSRAMLKNVDDKGKPLGMPMPNFGKVGFRGDQGHPPAPGEIKALQAYLKTLK